MFAVKMRPSDRKLTASTRPVTAVIPSRVYGMTFSVVELFAMTHQPTKYIAIPHCRPSLSKRLPFDELP
jgi:hypothetical protein